MEAFLSLCDLPGSAPQTLRDTSRTVSLLRECGTGVVVHVISVLVRVRPGDERYPTERGPRSFRTCMPSRVSRHPWHGRVTPGDTTLKDPYTSKFTDFTFVVQYCFDPASTRLEGHCRPRPLRGHSYKSHSFHLRRRRTCRSPVLPLAPPSQGEQPGRTYCVFAPSSRPVRPSVHPQRPVYTTTHGRTPPELREGRRKRHR